MFYSIKPHFERAGIVDFVLRAGPMDALLCDSKQQMEHVGRLLEKLDPLGERRCHFMRLRDPENSLPPIHFLLPAKP